MGSVTEQVVRNAACPVFSIHQPGRKADMNCGEVIL
jgi:hypothetical protein